MPFLDHQTRRISIHAPLTGCDVCPISIKIAEAKFQSTHPLRDATEAIKYKNQTVDISIHAPLTGCDGDKISLQKTGDISIHAPLTGCDEQNKQEFPMYYIFQSTHPLRDATSIPLLVQAEQLISIHAPLTGCDFTQKEVNRFTARISIHAPLTGCDF